MSTSAAVGGGITSPGSESIVATDGQEAEAPPQQLLLADLSDFPGLLLEQMNGAIAQTKQTREQSVANRKNLAETTKQFKKSVKTLEQAVSSSSSGSNDAALTPVMDAMSKECRKIVKSYQEEIDNLTRRCKASEQNYQHVFVTLSNYQDPIQNLQTESQNQQDQLLQTIDKLNQELENQQQRNQQLQSQINNNEGKNSSTSPDKAKSDENSPKKDSSALSNEEREELMQMRKEVAEYEVEFKSLKNQDITIRKLEDKIVELQTAGMESLEQSIQAAKLELELTEGRRASQALEREAQLQAKVDSLQIQLQSERIGREHFQNNILELDNTNNRREAAWEAQRQILVQDNEHIRQTLSNVQRENDDLQMQLAALTSGGGGGSYGSNKNNSIGSGSSRSSRIPNAPPSSGGVQDLLLERNAYEAEVSELSETNKMLREEIRTKAEQYKQETQKLQARVDHLERETANLNNTLASLESQLSEAPSQALVDNMKRELRILKRLEYNAADDVDTDRDPEIASRGGGNEQDNLEAVLVAKLRRAEKELIAERNSKNELVQERVSLQNALTKAESAQRESVQLVASLEKDLEKAIAAQASTAASASEDSRGRSKKGTTAATAAKQQQENSQTLQQILDPAGVIPSPPASSATPPTTAVATSEKAQDDHSVATIIMAQRDRLRARCEALEAERDSFKRELQGQVQAAESLKADNTKLYEKVRYLQSYSSNNSNSNPNSSHGRLYHRSNSSTAGDRDLDLEALEQRYEASVDPFKQFSKSERQRKLAEMSPMERTVFIVAKTVLSTKEMRTGLFFYVVALHLLVFVTTYHWSHSGDSCGLLDDEHRTFLPPALPAHIQDQIIAKDAVADTVNQQTG